VPRHLCRVFVFVLVYIKEMKQLQSKNVRIAELFASIQGEGPYIGVQQAFIRFAGCNLRCKYCDTDHTERMRAGQKQLLDFIAQAKPIHSVALTGGEPLEQAGFLKDFLPAVKKSGNKVYLETNGVLYQELRAVIKYVDIIAMDIKLPSSTGRKACWNSHRKFMEVMRAGKHEAFVKIVITPFCTLDELAIVQKLLSGSKRKYTVILQPEFKYSRDQELQCIMQAWQEKLGTYAQDVRIIPQVHKLVGIK
jgi:7-carboxy-7-deazaguanine synthase